MQASAAITRRSASNLALAFVLLPRERREGMCALYAFCREVDDVADDTATGLTERRAKLAEWREDITRACHGQEPRFAVCRELRPVIERYQLAHEDFEEVIKGVEMDLDVSRYETSADLELYCYRVASAVGLLSIRVFGHTDPGCRDYAIALGKALQFTNILRDIRNDAERDRVYLPQAELRRFGVTSDDILRLRYSPQFRDLARAFAGRARVFYREAARGLPSADRRAMVAAELMGSVYWQLLRKLEAREFDVFGGPLVRVGTGQKLLLILRTWFRNATGSSRPNYGSP